MLEGGSVCRGIAADPLHDKRRCIRVYLCLHEGANLDGKICGRSFLGVLHPISVWINILRTNEREREREQTKQRNN